MDEVFALVFYFLFWSNLDFTAETLNLHSGQLMVTGVDIPKNFELDFRIKVKTVRLFGQHDWF